MRVIRAALVLVVATALFGAPPAALAHDPTAYGYEAKGMRREVLGFLNHFDIDYALEHLDYGAVSTLAFFSVQADRYGRLMKRTSSGAKTQRWAAWSSPEMTTIIRRAHLNRTAVVLSVERFAWTSSGVEDTVALLSSPTARERLAQDIANAVDSRNVEGVNLDFEPIPSSQRANYVSFVRSVRRALDARQPGYQLTFAATGYIASYDVTALTAPGAADAVYIMGYQYRGSWSYRAGSTAPLAGPIYDVTDTVDAYLAKTTRDKIILGVPYYGYAWSTESSELHARTTPGYVRSILYRDAVVLGATYGVRYDTVEQSAWTAWRYRPCADCASSWRQLYWDNPRSLAAKYDLVNRRGLLGAGVWALGYEGDRPELYTLLKRKFGPLP